MNDKCMEWLKLLQRIVFSEVINRIFVCTHTIHLFHSYTQLLSIMFLNSFKHNVQEIYIQITILIYNTFCKSIVLLYTL